MKIAFTICTINHLAYGKAVADSFLQHNPDYKFIIGLVEQINGRLDKEAFKNCEIVEVDKIGINNIDRLYEKYDAFEFSCAVKASYMKYIFKRYEEASMVIYLDSDMLVFGKFIETENRLQISNIVITPHILTPKNDKYSPHEINFIRGGLFNLGFIAVAKSPESLRFLDWWEDRVIDNCVYDINHGVVHDQLWINLVPIYFEKVHIEKNPGYNVAYWNLHERRIACRDKKFYVNENIPLVFFHFSGFKVDNPGLVQKFYTDSYSFNERKDIVPLFDLYRGILLENNYQKYAIMPWQYSAKRNNKKTAITRLKALINKILLRLRK